MNYFDLRREELEKQARPTVDSVLGGIYGLMSHAGGKVRHAVKRLALKSKGEFRRGKEWGRNVMPSERRAATLDLKKQVEDAGKSARMKSFVRKALVYGGMGAGAAALGGGAYAVHRYTKKKREAEEQAAYPTL